MTLVPFTKIVPALAGFFALSAVCDYAVAHQKIFGGRPLSDMRTMTPAWKEAEKARFMNMVRAQGCLGVYCGFGEKALLLGSSWVLMGPRFGYTSTLCDARIYPLH